MSLQTLKPVKLTYSKAIKKGISNKNRDVLSEELKKQKEKGKEYRFLDEGRIKNNEVLEKTIHAYRIFFLFFTRLRFLLLEEGRMMRRRRSISPLQAVSKPGRGGAEQRANARAKKPFEPR